MSVRGVAGSGSVEGGALLVSADSRPLRGQLRPLGWVTLEEIGLDAVVEDGRLVARTSARQVADRLRIDPRYVAKELKALRDRGLVRLERDQGPARRFGLWVYVLGPVAGLTVVDAHSTPSSSSSLQGPGRQGFGPETAPS